MVVLEGLLLEVLEDVWPELLLQAVAEVAEQALHTVPTADRDNRTAKGLVIIAFRTADACAQPNIGIKRHRTEQRPSE